MAASGRPRRRATGGRRPRLTGARTISSGTIALLLFGVAAAGAAALRFVPVGWIEQGYAAGIYPQLTRLIVPLSARSPLPLSLTLAGLALIALPIGLVLRPRWGGRGVLLIASLLLIALTWFNLGWGLNYARAPIEEVLRLPDPPLAADAETERLLALLTRTVATNAAPPPDREAAVASLSRSLSTLVHEISGVRPTLPTRVRSLPGGTLLAGGFAGVISPFSLEAHVDAALPPAAFVATAAHELAHLAGFAREADAELIAALAGLRADHPFARYAVALGQWARLAAALDPQRRSTALARLPQRARDDLAALQAANERHRRAAPARLLNAVYHQWLLSQGVEAGIGDYGRSTDLLQRALLGGWIGGGRGGE